MSGSDYEQMHGSSGSEQELRERKAAKKRGAVIAGAVVVVIMLGWDIFLWQLNIDDPLPKTILVLYTLGPLAAVIGVLIALRERIREIEGGEEDEARDY